MPVRPYSPMLVGDEEEPRTPGRTAIAVAVILLIGVIALLSTRG